VPLREAKTFAVGQEITVKAKQLREMSRDELGSTLEDTEKRLFDLRSQAVTQKLENSKSIINVRRDVARIKTILHEKKK
jgi:large subunit ribosomal protein L29